MSDADDLLKEFLVESYESLDRLDGELLVLESNPEDRETLSSVFRAIHTIKGTCGFLELARLEAVTHVGENLLSSLRDGSVGMDDRIAEVLLDLVDAVREMLAHLEQHGVEGQESYAELILQLEELNRPLEEDASRATTAHEDDSSQDVHEHTGDGDSEDTPSGVPAPPEAGLTEPVEPVPGAADADSSQLAANNIRVQVEQLDKLMNLAGELVLARNQILQIAATSQDPATLSTSQRLNLITTELQERIMKVRMQPIGGLWSRFPRVVRDLAKTCGKEIELEMVGADTELDKTLLEAIKDPLTHILRNAADHGIEAPDDRAAAGKPRAGRLLLRAYHESGHVNIEIADDGKGISTDALKAKAVDRGVITADEAASMNARQATQLIFHPGFSTAAEVTNVSGRGVGMDVVRSNIERIGGSVHVVSEVGHGTTIAIKIPLTLAIIPALIVTSASDRYAIPQVNLVELVRLDGDQSLESIQLIDGSPILRLRGDLLPLVYLNESLELSRVETIESLDEEVRNIVVVRADQDLFGLVVDEINDTEEIVVKPLDQQIKSMDVYAGTTILGDGRVALIMDVIGLARRESILVDGRSGVVDDVASDSGSAVPAETYLLVQPRPDRRLAIPLDEVARLEELSRSSIESTGNHEVVQYRGDIMPIVRLGNVLDLGETRVDAAESNTVHAVVRTAGGRSVGLVVEEICDIVETRGAIRRPLSQAGLRESIVIDGRVTDLLDVDHILNGLELGGSIDATSGEAIDGASSTSDDAATGDVTRQLCTFYVEDLFLAVDVVRVQEVLRHQPMTRVPLTSDVVEGLINLRGQVVTALDTRTRLKLPRSTSVTPTDGSMNVVVRGDEGIVSMMVDRIGDVHRLSESLRCDVPSTVAEHLRSLLSGVYKLEGQLLLELDVDRLIVVEDESLAIA